MGCDTWTFLLFFLCSSCYASNNTHEFSYLDDIILELRNETWNENETTCLESILTLLEDVQNFKFWGTWVWDSMVTKPVGSLYGSQYHLGNYDQCLTESVFKDPALQTQYCLVNITLDRESLNLRDEGIAKYDPKETADNYLNTLTRFNQDLGIITWGVCVPGSCQAQSIERFVNKLLKHSHFSAVTRKARINLESCDVAKESNIYRLEDCLFIVFTGSLVIITVLFTIIYECRNKGDSEKSFYVDIAGCFSLINNYRKLTVTNGKELAILNGIRFLSSAVIVLLHQVFYICGAAIMNGVELEKLLGKIYVSWLLRADIAVDSFFMMSGLLLVTTCSSMKDITAKGLGKQLVKRYFRLAATLAVLLFFFSTVAQCLSSGPLWSKLMGFEVSTCRKNWWLSLLMLNNYIDREEMCFPIYWSTYCDYHFSIVGTALVFIINKHRRTGIFIFAVTFVAALILPGYFTEYYNLPPALNLGIPFFKELRKDASFIERYIASHNRLAAYLVGMMFGYVLNVYKPSDYKQKISKSWSVTGAVVSLAVMFCITELGKSYYVRDYNRIEAIMYAALNRPLWAFAIGLIILCGVYGTVPFAESFLASAVFRPLSRLTYGVYMVHAIIYMYNTYSLRVPYYVEMLPVVIDFLGTLVVSYILSLLLWLFVESPSANIVFLMFATRRDVPIKPTKEDAVEEKRL